MTTVITLLGEVWKRLIWSDYNLENLSKSQFNIITSNIVIALPTIPWLWSPSKQRRAHAGCPSGTGSTAYVSYHSNHFQYWYIIYCVADNKESIEKGVMRVLISSILDNNATGAYLYASNLDHNATCVDVLTLESWSECHWRLLTLASWSECHWRLLTLESWSTMPLVLTVPSSLESECRLALTYPRVLIRMPLVSMYRRRISYYCFDMEYIIIYKL